jgi:uncharacterized protein (TIGR03066 family)
MRTACLASGLSVLALAMLLAPARAEEKKKADKPQDLIVGKWVPAKESDKEKGTVEFTKDGKVILKLMEGDKKIDINGTYKFITDDKVEVELDFMGEKKKETLKIKVTKDELTSVDEKDREEKFKRAK